MNWVKGAKAMLGAGLSVVPIPKMWFDPDNKDFKYNWKDYQHQPMSEAEAETAHRWVKYKDEEGVERNKCIGGFAKAEGIAIVCGAVSGNLVTIDFDSKPKYERWKAEMLEVFPELFGRLVIEETPSGFHVFVRCAEFEEVPGNEKWAYVMRDKAKYCTIETRGEGGLIFCTPTPGYKVVQGNLLTIPTITFDEFMVLEALARSLDEVGGATVPDKHVRVENAPYATGDRPGDVYNRTVSWDDLLGDMGATVQFRKGDRIMLCRPGKKRGVSGTTGNGRAGQDLFYCFSSNWHPFEEGKCYSKFKVFTMLRHGDDWNKSTKAAAEQLGLIRTVKRDAPDPKVVEKLAEAMRVEVSEEDQIMESLIADITEIKEPGEWHGSDMGNAEQFAAFVDGKLKYCNEWKAWVRWTGKFWDTKEIGRGSAVALYRELIAPLKETDSNWWAKCMASARLNATLDVAKDLPELRCKPSDFDTDNSILNTQDGIVDLVTGAVTLHDPKRMCANITECGVVPTEEGIELVSRFVNDICVGDQDLMDALQIFLGYSINGGNPEEVFCFWSGKGLNGKSTMTKVLLNILGGYAHSLQSEVILESRNERSPWALEDMKGARIAAIAEPSSFKRLDREFLKTTSSCEPVMVARKHQNQYAMIPTFTMIICTNTKPQLEFDEAIMRRIAVIPWMQVLEREKADKKLDQKLTAAGSSLLAWLIQGSVDYHARGSLIYTESMNQALTEYVEENDSLQRFLNERTQRDEMNTEYVLSTKLSQAYGEWAKDTGAGQLRHQQLVQKMRAKGFEISDCGSMRHKGFKGLILLDGDK